MTQITINTANRGSVSQYAHDGRDPFNNSEPLM